MIDFDALLNGPVLDTFGEVLLYARQFEPDFQVRGIFDRKHVPIEFADGAVMSATEVTLSVRRSDFPAQFTPGQGDRLQLRDATWFVQDVRPDAEGMMVLVLSSRNPLDA